MVVEHKYNKDVTLCLFVIFLYKFGNIKRKVFQEVKKQKYPLREASERIFLFIIEKWLSLLDSDMPCSIDNWRWLALRDVDSEDAIGHLGCNLVILDIVRQCECLLVL